MSVHGDALPGIAIGVSGSGSNLRALVAAATRGELGGGLALVFADRPCPALDWAAEQGIETIHVPGGDDDVLAATLAAVEPDVLVLAGYLRLVGPGVLARSARPVLSETESRARRGSGACASTVAGSRRVRRSRRAARPRR